MRRGFAIAVSALLVSAGCGTMRENRTACLVGTTLAGGALGATGGGLGVSEVENGPDNGERAAGAGVGLVAGSLIGFLVGHYACQPEEKPAPPPPPIASPPPAPPSRKIATLMGPSFDFNKATLRPEGRQKVEHAAGVLRENVTVHVVVEGHTDSVGSDAYNQRLSERRAASVRDYLVEKGISPSRIRTQGYGETRPVASNATEEGRAQNRRVEINIE